LPSTGFKGDSVKALQEHLVECLRSGSQAESEGRVYLHTVNAVTACYESAEKGLPVDLLQRRFVRARLRNRGCADTHYGGLVRITSENEWKGADRDDTFRQGAINNVQAFVASIRDGKTINNADQSVESNLTAILGRTAAYQQRVVTWEEMLKSSERLRADLKLKW
jgi:hypothetical protein